MVKMTILFTDRRTQRWRRVSRKLRPRKLRPQTSDPENSDPENSDLQTPKNSEPENSENLNSFQFLSPKKCYGHAMLIGSIPKTQTPKTPPNKLSWNITNGQRFHIKIICCIATYSLYVAVTPPLVWAEILIWWIRGNGNLRMPAQMI